MSNFAWWYYTLNFSCSLHFQWPWRYVKVTPVSNSVNLKFYLLYPIKWKLFRMLSTSRRSLIFHYFWLSPMFKGHNWRVSECDKRILVCFLTDTVQTQFFKLCTSLAWGLPIHTRFVSRSQVFQNYKLQIIFFRSLSTVVWTLCGSYVH